MSTYENPTLELFLTSEQLPPENVPVIISGGAAFYRDGKWWSMMSYPYREIEWHVDWWTRFFLVFRAKQ